MTMRLFEQCPLGCEANLLETSITLPEGALRQCPNCKQLLSACDKAWYEESMQEFDQPQGTLPTGKSAARYAARMGSILRGAANRLGIPPRELRLLDVGCSSGALLKVAHENGFQVSGAEPAPQAAQTAQSMGFDVFPGFLQDAHFPDNHFDIVTLFEVIEHLTDPIALVSEIRRILKPGGILLLGTANASSWTVGFIGNRWEYFDIRSHGGHISFFNPTSTRLLAERTGFEVARISTKRVNMGERKDLSVLSYNVNRLLREILALPARWFGKGHDMLAVLRKPEGS